jgi:hypothetical protein
VNPAREVEILRSIRQHAPATAILCITRRPGPTSLADAVAELPPAGSHRDVAAPGELESAEVSVFASLAASNPYDPRLLEIISGIHLSGDRPTLPEEVATADAAPSLRSMLRPQGRRIGLAVARLLGLTPEEIDEIAQAAELHDIGKVAIPDAILHKPAPLDDREWAFMRRHTLIGERIVAAAPALGRVAHIVRSTHERYDGGGYPDGLLGLDIPLGARIVAVCDAFDAMTTDRPYRTAMTAESALSELRTHSGSQFDPVVVEAFDAAWLSQPSYSQS